jgi:hypothetical protein
MKQYWITASTDNQLLKNWNSSFFARAFPFCLGRAVGGADFKNKTRPRRPDDAPELEPQEWAKMLATRVEASIRNDWLAIPCARNLSTKYRALCGKSLACKHFVDPNKAGVEQAAEVTTAAAALYQKLEKGYWWDGAKNRKINHDVSKLQYAVGLSTTERNLVRDLQFLSSTVAGTQQIRLEMGHALFGARVMLGDPLFITISPNSRLSGLCVRLSRYRVTDPAILHSHRDSISIAPWHSAERPGIWSDGAGDLDEFEVPDYNIRRVLAAKDPWAVLQNFSVAIKFLLARLLGCSMCPFCPHCNQDSEECVPCSNRFGHNLRPMGGTSGLCVGFGGAVEYQQNDNPHFHGNAHLVSMYQYMSLHEIATLM